MLSARSLITKYTAQRKTIAITWRVHYAVSAERNEAEHDVFLLTFRVNYPLTLEFSSRRGLI